MKIDEISVSRSMQKEDSFKTVFIITADKYTTWTLIDYLKFYEHLKNGQEDQSSEEDDGQEDEQPCCCRHKKR